MCGTVLATHHYTRQWTRGTGSPKELKTLVLMWRSFYLSMARTQTQRVVAGPHCMMLPASDLSVGIDVGLHHFAALSDASFIANPRFFALLRIELIVVFGFLDLALQFVVPGRVTLEFL